MIKENKILSIVTILRLILRYLHFLIIVPLILFAIVYSMTQDQPREYSSSTVIYTGLASGYSIESQGDSKIDFFGVKNAFDNLINIIKSRKTLEKVGLKLLTQHLMLEEHNNRIINKDHYNELMAKVPEEILQLVDYNSFENTYTNLVEYKNASDQNYIHDLLNLSHPHYSIEKISRVKVRRMQNSDLIDISYTTNDPGICKYTLVYLIESFKDDYTGLKENQTDAVVRYFENQLRLSERDLNQAEEDLLQFNKKNNIINYHEQTKFIASQKEDLELEYQRTLMTLRGAEAVLASLEAKLDTQSKLMLNSDKIIQLRNELGEINGKITLMELGQDNDTINTSNRDAIVRLKKRSAELKIGLKQAIDSLYIYSSVKSGLSSRSVFENWLQNAIIYEETEASLSVLDDRLEQFKKKYATFAPLGASMKRIERKIDVTEQEYLSLLHSLALAKLKQQNIELSSNLKVLDDPFFPLEPLPSKRNFLLAISLLGGAFMVLFLIIVIEYLDQNIKNHSRAEQKTGLEVAGLFPVLMNSKKVNIPEVKKTAVEHVVKNLNLTRLKEINKSRPYTILVFSTRSEEGKSTIAIEIMKKLNAYGMKSLFLNFNKQEDLNSEEYDYFTYDPGFKCFEAEECRDLIANERNIVWENYDFAFFEIPSITHNHYSVRLLSTVDFSWLVCRANRPWTIADANALKTITEINNINPQVIVNGVEIHEMESIVGELPRRRSLVRRVIKRILTLQFLSGRRI